MNTRQFLAYLCIFCLVMLAGLALRETTATAAPASGRALRVGVYDSRAVCVGSRNSGAIQKQVEELRKQLKDAEAAGDTKRAEEIKNRGATLQSVRHLQAFSSAPVDDILVQIKDQLPAIAEKAGVDIIVAKADYSAAGVEIVDVTDALVNAFHPDDKTLETVAQLRKHPPMEMVDVLSHKD